MSLVAWLPVAAAAAVFAFGAVVVVRPGRRQGGSGWAAPLAVGGVVVVAALAAAPPAPAHQPVDHQYRWTCAFGDGPSDDPGTCYLHHTNATADWFPNGHPPTAVQARWRNGAAEWDLSDGHEFNFTERNDSTSAGVNWLSSDPCGNTSWHACTYIWWSGDHITESQSYLHFESDLNWYTSTGTTPSWQLDLWGTASHEFGHYLGLGHADSRWATMWPAQLYGESHQRSSHADDRLGRCQVYGHAHSYWGGC